MLQGGLESLAGDAEKAGGGTRTRQRTGGEGGSEGRRQVLDGRDGRGEDEMKWGQEMDWREPGRIGRRRQKSPKMTVPQLLAALLACLASTRTVRYCTAAVRAARAANGGTRTICLGPWVCPDRRGHPRIHETEGLESVNGGRGHRFSAQAETATRRGSDGRVRVRGWMSTLGVPLSLLRPRWVILNRLLQQ